MMVRGSVDVVTETEVRGWAFAPGRREAVLVQAVLNHEILGEATAGLHRPDLAAAGLGDGNSGYEIRLFRPISPLYAPFLVVKVEGGDTELPRAPLLGFGEFFAALHAAHPAAGRHRSVFGGLWTDRTDAAALLRGKVAVGQVAAEVAAGVERLIQEGLAVVELRRRPGGPGGWGGRDAASVSPVLDDPALLPLLRAVLEDAPVAVARDADVGEDGFWQASATNPSPSPAECLAIVVASSEGVVLDVVRDSHRLPEFTPHGVSRWGSRSAADGAAMAREAGLLDRRTLEPREAAVIGPGTLVRVHGAEGAAIGLCLPMRAVPAGMAPVPMRPAGMHNRRDPMLSNAASSNV